MSRTEPTVEHREDSSFDAEDGCVEVLAVAEDVELDVVVAEAEDVPLLELGGEAVLLAAAGPHLPARGHRPAVVVQPEVGVEVSCRGADTRAPHAALLHLHLQHQHPTLFQHSIKLKYVLAATHLPVRLVL